MLKRTTIYLEESELETLKTLSFVESVPMSELIRRGVQKICNSYSDEKKSALSALTQIKAEAKQTGITPQSAMESALKAQKEVRRERQTRRR